MKIKTIVASSPEAIDAATNTTELELQTKGTPVKFTQTHIACDSQGRITGYVNILFYNG